MHQNDQFTAKTSLPKIICELCRDKPCACLITPIGFREYAGPTQALANEPIA